MKLFLILFAECLIGGVLTISLIWVFFWAVGIFDAPEPFERVLPKLTGFRVTLLASEEDVPATDNTIILIAPEPFDKDQKEDGVPIFRKLKEKQ